MLVVVRPPMADKNSGKVFTNISNFGFILSTFNTYKVWINFIWMSNKGWVTGMFWTFGTGWVDPKHLFFYA
ncbi:hypothetical protein Hanom_Chr10g00875091 [Helianthus anomalus]